MFRFVAFFAILAISQAAVTVVPAAPIVTPGSHEFGYHVADPLRGNFQNHVQARIGDAISGSYSLLESDGTTRVVDYTADGIHGFNANVRHEAAAVVPAIAKTVPVVTPVETVAPVVAPVETVAPVAEIPTPVAKIIPEVPVTPVAPAPIPFFRYGYNHVYPYSYPYAFPYTYNCLYGNCVY